MTTVQWGATASGGDLLKREYLIREIRAAAEALAGEAPSPAERLLAHRVAICQHAVNRAESLFASAFAPGARDRGELTISMADFLGRWVDGAHRRLLQAIKTLAIVRRLARPGPSVSVSVAQSVTVEASAAARQVRDDPPLMA